MKFTPLASSSKGNAYLLESEGPLQSSPLLIESGIPINQLREKVGFKLSRLAGCLISHEHQDHSRAFRDLLKSGVDCYTSHGTAIALGIEDSHRCYLLESNLLRDIEGTDWRVLPFALEHDAIEPLGFYISHGFDRFLFIPDTAFVANTFTGITQIAIECNYISEILSKNILSGSLPAVVGKRIRRNHMSLENVIQMLKANDLSKCRAIHLIHLSDGNSDEAEMIRKVQEATGVPCYAA